MANLDNWIDKLKKQDRLSVDVAGELAAEGIFPQDVDVNGDSVEELLDPYGDNEDT